jgi:tetratricopeptide (TPR) repeat protein
MSESEIKDENILGHFQEAMLRASGPAIDRAVQTELVDSQVIDAEYACLMSMMLEPKSPTMWNALALVHMMSSKARDAEEAIKHSLDIDTSNSWTWTIWGDLLRWEDRTIESERAYRMAVELDPDNDHALRQLVFIYDSRGAHLKTLHILESLLPLSPEDQEIWNIYSRCFRRESK